MKWSQHYTFLLVKVMISDGDDDVWYMMRLMYDEIDVWWDGGGSDAVNFVYLSEN